MAVPRNEWDGVTCRNESDCATVAAASHFFVAVYGHGYSIVGCDRGKSLLNNLRMKSTAASLESRNLTKQRGRHSTASIQALQFRSMVVESGT
jgi:hypothetical protein